MMGLITETILFILVIPCMGQQMVSFDEGNFNVSWTFNQSSDKFEFLVDVRSTGWVGFGFSMNPPPGMINYDVAVGGVFSNGTTYLQDYYTKMFGRPLPELNQDFTLLNATEQNQITSLAFSRKRNTSDPEDVAIQQGLPVFLIWAYHRTSDVDTFEKHEFEGVQSAVILPALPSTAPWPTTTVAPMLYQRDTSFDSGNFKVYWSYNSSSDSLYFTLDVAAIGWVGFGFSRNAPSGMIGYDVVVAGVRNGNMYLKDYLTQGFRFPPEDQQQDAKLMYATEKDGRTMISYSRKRDTKDPSDVTIEKGVMYYLVWAYHSSDDSNTKHEKAGFAKMIVIPEDGVATQQTTTGTGQSGGAEQGSGIDVIEKENDRLFVITVLLAVTLGLMVVCLFLVAMGLSYIKGLIQRGQVAK